MRKAILFFSIIIFALNFAFANYSENKLLIRIKKGIINPKDKLFHLSRELNINYQQLLPENLSISNPKMQKLIQSKNLNLNAIQQAEEPLLRTFTLVFDHKIDPIKLSQKIKERYEFIEIAEPVYNYQIMGYVPNDTYFSSQETLLQIKAPEAWEIWKGDPSVVVAISDNGFRQDHEDLTGNIYVNENEIPNNGKDDDNNGYIDDFRGYNFAGAIESQGWGGTFSSSIDHGTMVAGISSAHFDNKKGIAGVGAKCKFFPIKASGKSASSIEYGNESIIFAAVHKFKVLNLSWGGPRAFSELEQSIINYAVANDVAIVAAGGNIGTNGGTRYDTFYPAGYFGVLGVGEVDEFDEVTAKTSNLGPQVAIMAPGDGNYSTKNSGSYGYTGGGTSFSTPIVSGAVALARSKYPQLSAIQALEFVRQCGDNILAKNSMNIDKALIPLRINLYKVVTIDPFSIPAIKPIKYIYKNSQNIVQDRFSAGDTVRLNILARNFLGEARYLNLTLSVAYDPAKSIELVNKDFQLPLIKPGEEAQIGDFVFVITRDNSSKVIFRVDIKGENGYSDMFKFEFIPTKPYATFESENIIFSMSDDGKFGFVEIGAIKEGWGFTIKGIGNQLYGNSGLIASENSDRLVSFYYDNFYPIKKFIQPEPNKNLMNDQNTNTINKIGIEISQNIWFPTSKIAQIDISIKNKSGRSLNKFAIGNFYDWDILEKSDSNYAELFNEINTHSIKDKFGGLGAEIIFKPGSDFYLACVAFSNFKSEPQIAGTHYDYIGSFPKEIQLALLNSGTSIQFDKIDDRSLFTGIRFTDPIPPDGERDLSLLIGYHTNRTELANEIIKVLNLNTIHQETEDLPITVITDLSRNEMKIKLDKQLFPDPNVAIYDLFGKLINCSQSLEDGINDNLFSLQLPNIENQVLFVVVRSSLHNSVKKIYWFK